MIKNVLSKLKQPKTDQKKKNPVFTNEFQLLVSRGRVIDYSHAKSSYNLNVDLGIYNDTYQYLTKGLDEASAKLNVFKVLSSVTGYFEKMIHATHEDISKEKARNKDYQPPSKRIQKQFLVDDLELPNGKIQGVFCINLLTRPDALFVIIGLKPKGKLRTRLGDVGNVTIWKK